MQRLSRPGNPGHRRILPTGHGGLSAEQLHENVLAGSRIVAELGADAIKTFYTSDFKQMTACCPVPVLGLGAEKLPTQQDALMLAQREVADRAGGVVFGRNAIQVPDPFAFQAALCDVVKRSAPSEEAAKRHGLAASTP